jgi:hypothetical protein
MKTIFFSFLFLLLISSCATQKKSATQITASAISGETRDTQTGETLLSEQFIESETEESEDTDIHIIRYDTTQPVDSLTGKPPVKEEEFRSTVKKTGKKSQATQKEKAESAQSQKQSAFTNSNTDVNQTGDTSIEVAGGGSFHWIWITAGLTAGAAILFPVFTRKNRKK